MWTSFFYTIKCLFDKYKVLKYLMFFMILGSIFGSFFANGFINQESSSILSNFISNFFKDYSANIAAENHSFFRALLKNAKYFVIIWLLGFNKFGCIFVFFIIFLKGVSYGFTMAFFIIEFGILGVLYASSFYLIQNIILIPFYLYISYKCFCYSSNKLYLYKNPCFLRNYLLLLLLMLILICIISLFDVFVSPKIIAIFI